MLWFKMMMALLVTAGVRKPFSAPRAPGQTICKFRQWKANGQFFGHISVPPVGTSQDIAVLPWGYCSPRVGIPQHSRGDTAALRETDVAALYRQTLRRSRDTLFSGKGIGAAPRCVCAMAVCYFSPGRGAEPTSDAVSTAPCAAEPPTMPSSGMPSMTMASVSSSSSSSALGTTSL